MSVLIFFNTLLHPSLNTKNFYTNENINIFFIDSVLITIETEINAYYKIDTIQIIFF